jgi:feruloyl esterase
MIRVALSAAIVAIAATALGGERTQTTGSTCEQLATLTIPDVKVASAELVAAGSFSATPGGRGFSVPSFCRVALTASPSSDSMISIEVWLPLAAVWNRKFLGTDNGGFSGAINYGAMASAIARGYATAGTDTGHTGDQMEFGHGHPEKLIDWAYRAVHVSAELGKLVTRNHYGRFADRAYFSGCSTGGQQALSEAQRFPQDYDGVVAGDPGNNRVALILGFLWAWTATHADDGSLILPNSKLPAITRAAVDACDAGDGLKDGLISEPLHCRFDPASLLCKGGETDTCLTESQVGAVKKVYDGAKNRRTGKQIFAGWARGSEQGWPQYITSPREPVRVGLFRYFVYDDPNWHWRTFDWDRDVDFVQTQAAVMNAMSVDYRAFRTRGGKIVMYTGLADPVVPPGDIISYYDAVTAASGGLQETQKFFRFFPIPGMGHCSGGTGPNNFDALGALEAWVERGTAPTRIVASHSTAGAIDRTRPLCPYPQTAVYEKRGSIDDETSFTCAAK